MKTFNFETETSQILKLLTHSIYSNKEIFIRELISNSSDAIDKAKIKSLQDTKYLWDDINFKIQIDFDKDKKTISIKDNWIWMTEDELHKNIWTIAKSWTKDFIDKLKEAKQENINTLIWQFGIWFYSVFMVAEKVELITKSSESKKWYKWISTWEWNYQVEEFEKIDRWTEVIIYINSDNEEFLDGYKIRNIIKTYSNYIQIPVMMKQILSEEDIKNKKTAEYEQINEMQSIWNKKKHEVKKDEYNNFYKSIWMDYNEPLSEIHLNIEWMINYNALLFIPKEKAMTFLQPEQDYGPKLFVQNVLILENCKELLPVWLRFIKWVVETNDIQLNISREMLQQNTILNKIQTWLTSKIISKLKNLMKKKTAEYDVFLNNYSWYLKEWIHFDMNNKEKIAELIKYESLLKWKNITLDEYIQESDKEQKEIYFITGKNKSEILSSPYLEEFKNKNIDVLLMFDPIDEWVTQDLPEFKWKNLKSITDQDIDLWDKNIDDKKEEKETKEKEYKTLLEFIKKTIWEDKIESVNLSNRLGENIWALASKQWWVSPQMEKMMKAMWQPIPPQKRILEINPENKLVKTILEEYKKSPENKKLNDLALYIYEQSLIRQGGEIEDLKWFVDRMNKFAEKYL